MKPNKYTRRMDLYNRLAKLGFTMEEADKLRRIEKTLHRWAEMECGDSNDHASWVIERDEKTGKPYRLYCNHRVHPTNTTKTPIADRERGALKRLEAIIKTVNNRHEFIEYGQIKWTELWFYHQTDPRDVSVYVGRKSDLRPNQELSSCYSSAGVAVAD